jgi:hypothetical protein
MALVVAVSPPDQCSDSVDPTKPSPVVVGLRGTVSLWSSHPRTEDTSRHAEFLLLRTPGLPRINTGSGQPSSAARSEGCRPAGYCCVRQVQRMHAVPPKAAATYPPFGQYTQATQVISAAATVKRPPAFVSLSPFSGQYYPTASCSLAAAARGYGE